jgi:DNA-binding NarL/FixJ family response regulator
MLVEDHALFREMMCGVCQRDFGWTVVAETGRGSEVVQMVKRFEPEIIILDLYLPDMDGFAIIEELRKRKLRLRILIVSSNCDDYTVYQIERLGVNGFLDKNSTTRDGLKQALGVISEGRTHFSSLYHDTRMARIMDQKNFAARLTDWEQAILKLIGGGLNDEEIGGRLGISPKTVMTHRSRIMKKLNISGTPKLMRYALDHGFTHIEASMSQNRAG